MILKAEFVGTVTISMRLGICFDHEHTAPLNLPGHGSTLQASVSLKFPWQGIPPCFGSLHSLWWYWVPEPQTKVQLVQEVHSNHTPSTGQKKKFERNYIFKPSICEKYEGTRPISRRSICDSRVSRRIAPSTSDNSYVFFCIFFYWEIALHHKATFIWFGLSTQINCHQGHVATYYLGLNQGTWYLVN